jgi:hypothetical protein
MSMRDSMAVRRMLARTSGAIASARQVSPVNARRSVDFGGAVGRSRRPTWAGVAATFPFADAARLFDRAIGGEIVDLDKEPGIDESGFHHGLLTAVCRASLDYCARPYSERP